MSKAVHHLLPIESYLEVKVPPNQLVFFLVCSLREDIKAQQFKEEEYIFFWMEQIMKHFKVFKCV